MSSLSTGAIIGIVLGSLVLLMMILFFVYWSYRSKKYTREPMVYSQFNEGEHNTFDDDARSSYKIGKEHRKVRINERMAKQLERYMPVTRISNDDDDDDTSMPVESSMPVDGSFDKELVQSAPEYYPSFVENDTDTYFEEMNERE
jgi:hypothetical protein